jgi:hypothetical protein
MGSDEADGGIGGYWRLMGSEEAALAGESYQRGTSWEVSHTSFPSDPKREAMKRQ